MCWNPYTVFLCIRVTYVCSTNTYYIASIYICIYTLLIVSSFVSILADLTAHTYPRFARWISRIILPLIVFNLVYISIVRVDENSQYLFLANFRICLMGISCTAAVVFSDRVFKNNLILLKRTFYWVAPTPEYWQKTWSWESESKMYSEVDAA